MHLQPWNLRIVRHTFSKPSCRKYQEGAQLLAVGGILTWLLFAVKCRFYGSPDPSWWAEGRALAARTAVLNLWRNCSREHTSSFLKTLSICFSTVRGLRRRRVAISAVLSRRARREHISASRAVKVQNFFPISRALRIGRDGPFFSTRHSMQVARMRSQTFRHGAVLK